MTLPNQRIPLVDPFIPCQAQLWGSSQWLLRHTMACPQISLWSTSQWKKTPPRHPLPLSLLGLHSRPGHVICGTQCKMKIQGPLFKKDEEFQKSNNSRAVNQAQGPVWLHRSLTHEANPVSQSPRSQLYPWVWPNPSKFSLLFSVPLGRWMKPRSSHLLSEA